MDFDQQPIVKLILSHSTLKEEKNVNDRSQIVVYQLMLLHKKFNVLQTHPYIFLYVPKTIFFKKAHPTNFNCFRHTSKTKVGACVKTTLITFIYLPLKRRLYLVQAQTNSISQYLKLELHSS
jgi:hypothetical protein